MDFVLPVEELLAPIAGSSPCGTLEPGHSAQIEAMRAAIESKPAATTAPDWQTLRSAAETLFRGGMAKDLTDVDRQIEFKPVKHLGPAMVLTVVALQTDGLAGFAAGLDLVARLLDKYWDTLYPLRVDDDEPFYPRANLLSPLGLPYNELRDSWKFLERVYAARLIEAGRNGPLSVRDCLFARAATLKLSLPAGPEITEEAVLYALPDPAQSQSRRDALSRAISAAEKIEKVFRDKAANQGTPALDELRKVLKAAGELLEGKKQIPADPVTPTEKPSTGPVQNGAIASSQDAIRRLDELIAYFRKEDKTSPVPFMLERAKTVIDKNFLEVLEQLNELGEQAPKEFRKMAGIKATANPPKSN